MDCRAGNHLCPLKVAYEQINPHLPAGLAKASKREQKYWVGIVNESLINSVNARCGEFCQVVDGTRYCAFVARKVTAEEMFSPAITLTIAYIQSLTQK